MNEFWLKDPIILIKDYLSFFPNKEYDFNYNLNAITRFAVYMLIIAIVLTDSPIYYYLAVLLIVTTILIYYAKEDQQKKENICQKPTNNNPYANTLLTDVSADKHKLPACEDNENDKTKESSFMHNLYLNSTDLFAVKNQERQYNYVPENDQEKFIQGLYHKDKYCKTDNECMRYENLRNNYRN